MAEPSDTIRDYIRANRDRYTREAITAQLAAGGHDPDDIEAAWDETERAGSPPEPTGPVAAWVLAILIVLGVVAVFVTWRNQSYGANVIAPIVYAIATSIAVAASYGIARLAQRGAARAAAVWLGFFGLASAVLFWLLTLWPIAIGLLVVFGASAVVLSRSGTMGRGVMVVSWLPLLIWLVSTGTCVAPAVLSGSAV